MAKSHRKQTVAQQIMAEVRSICTKERYQNDNTRTAYYRYMKKYVSFCRESYNVKTLEECKAHIQEYADYLSNSDKKLSAFTIHTYLSGITSILDVRLSSIKKPQRVIANIYRGRRKENSTEESPSYETTIRFCKAVGIRRSELTRLRKEDFRLLDDNTGEVFVARGKGGKTQRQLVFNDLSFVQSMFDKTPPGERVFKPKELDCRLNIHKYRALHAQEAYKRCEEILKTPGGEEKLKCEIIEYWNQYKNTPFPEKMIEGTYTLRGKTRQMVLEQRKKGYPLNLHFRKISLLHTSMYALSHMRCSVACLHYMLYTDAPANA